MVENAPPTSNVARWHNACAPGLDYLAALAEAAVADIPNPLRRHLEGVVFRVDDWPDDDVMTQMGLETPFDLLGLYQGVSLAEKSQFDSGGLPDTVILYRRAILDVWAEGEERLGDLVRHVLIHEVGHHFGFSDDDMTALERDGDPTG